MSTNAPTTNKQAGHAPSVFLFIGILFLAFFFVAFMAQIQTTEANSGWGGATVLWQPAWSILLQPFKFFGIFGVMSADEGQAAFVGWAVEVLYAGFVFAGIEVLTHAVSRSGKFFGKLFLVCAAGVLLYNGWNDYHFGTLGTGDAGHWAFALAMSAVVGFFGSIGLVCLEKGWKHI